MAGAKGLPDRLFWARMRAGLSLRELGEQSKHSYSQVWRVENGIATLDVVSTETIAAALKVRSAWLAFGDGEP